jgi:hypothetical protein
MKTLEKIINSAKEVAGSVKKFAGLLCLTGALYSTGCGSINQRVAMETYFTANSNLTEAARTIPVHPDEGGAAAGSLTLGSDLGETEIRYGFEYLPDFNSGLKKSLEFKLGADIGIDMMGKEKEIFTKGTGSESYGVLTVEYPLITLTPFAGVEFKMAENAALSIELGARYTSIAKELEYYRWNSYETYDKDIQRGVGLIGRLSITFNLNKDQTIGLEYKDSYYRTIKFDNRPFRLKSFGMVFNWKF